MEDRKFFRVYLSENGGGVNATSVVVTFEGQKVFAIVFLQCVRAARRGSNAQLSRNVLPGFLFCALWVEQDQTCVEKNRNPIWWLRWKMSNGYGATFFSLPAVMELGLAESTWCRFYAKTIDLDNHFSFPILLLILRMSWQNQGKNGEKSVE